MKSIFLFFGLMLLSLSWSLAQQAYTQTVRGTVSDALTGYPLPGATVLLVGSQPPVGTITDENGQFELTQVPVGRRSFELSFTGYQKALVPNLLVETGKELQLNLRLQEETIQMDEVVVKATRPKDRTQNELAFISARSFSVEETERFAGSLGDPARMVANYAGVMTQNDSRNDIIIRGNSPAGVLWRIEGIETGNPNHFGAMGTTGGPVSMVNNNLLANSDFLTGAFPAEYGNALAGAFDLHLRSGNRSRFEGLAQVGFNGFELGLEGPLWRTGKGQAASALVNYRYSTMELIDKMGFDLGTGASIPHYNDLTFVFDMPTTKAGRWKLFGLYGSSNISFGRTREQLEANSYNARSTATDFGSELWLTGLTHTWFLAPETRLRTTLSYQIAGAEAVVDSMKLPEMTVLPYFRGTQREGRLNATTQWMHKFDARNNVNLGAIYTRTDAQYDDSVFRWDEQRFRQVSTTQGQLHLMRLYGQWQHHFGARLSSLVGLHGQFLGTNQSWALEPRIGLRWQANARHSVHAGYGLHSQTQTIGVYRLQTWLDDGRFERSNDLLGFTRSHHLVAGWEVKLADQFRLKLESYYQHLFDVPITRPGADFQEFSLINSGDSFGGVQQDSLVNQGLGRNYGLEFTLEKFLSQGYYFLLTASLFDSKYQAADGKWRNTAFNGNYVFNLLGGYEFNLGPKTLLTLDLKMVWAGGRRYVPIDLQASAIEHSPVYDWSQAYEQRYDDYLRADLRIGVKLNARRFSQEWGLDLQNFTGYQSIFAESYDADRNEVYYVYQQGFVPMMLYRIRF